MRIQWVELGIVAVAAFLIGGLAYLTQRSATAPPPSVPSTFDTGRSGYRALFETLRAAGVPVRHFGHVAARLDPDVRTLVIAIDEDALSGNVFSQGPGETKGVTQVLERFVKGGGRLIEIDTKFAGKDDIAPQVGTSKPAPKGTSDAIVVANAPQTRGVERVEGPIDAVFPFGSSVGVPLLANASGVVATRSTYGKGDVVAITAPSLFANLNLDRAQNAVFAYDLTAGRGPVAFDDYLYGFDEEACTMVLPLVGDISHLPFGLGDMVCWYRAMPKPVQVATWIVLAIVALALVGANVPFAPPVPREAPDERDTSAYLRSMGALMRRARAGAAAIAAFAADARRRARGMGNRSTTNALAELDRLAAIPHPVEAVVLRAARIDYELRKDRT